MLAISPDNDGRPVKLLQNARGHDANNSEMPKQLALDDDEINFGLKPGPDGFNRFVGNAPLDGLALAVLPVQILRQGQRSRLIASKEKLKGGFCAFCEFCVIAVGPRADACPALRRCLGSES